MKYKNCIVLITGFPGSGKLTTAMELSKKAEFKLAASYIVNKPILNLVHHDGVTLPPEAVWEKIEKIWDIVYETIMEISPKEFNFVFTRPLINSYDYSKKFYDRVYDLATIRNSQFLPVRLECKSKELQKRIQSEERHTLGKIIAPERAIFLSNNHEVFRSGHPNELTINNTTLEPSQVVDLILKRLKVN